HTIATPATDTNYTATYNAQAGTYGPTTFSNTVALTIPDHGIGNPYPSVINVNGLSGVVSKVTVTVSNFSHTYPHDVGWLLVSPTGLSTLLMADAGGGFRVNGVTLTFDDAAPSRFTSSGQIASGTYKPATFNVNDP